jgi:hypothetical protein
MSIFEGIRGLQMGTFDGLTDVELLKLTKQIRPVAYFHDKLHYLNVEISMKGLRGTSFIWNAEKNIGNIATDIEELTIIVCKFTAGAPVFFKPTISEVLSQIPKEVLPEVVAFEIPDQLLVANNCCESRIDGKWVLYHVATVRLYKKNKGEVIKDET